MSFKRTQVCKAALAAIGGAVVLTSVPSLALAQAGQRIEITGSRIKRVDAEGPLPVQTVTREEIDRRGAITLNEVINNLTLISQGSFAETQSAGNSFAPGTSGVSLRGLGSNATLVLLNGRRLANYGFAQNLDEAFVDLNSIPLSAVERIEVLKDGASAVYGSDAIAGVINIILRSDYTGAQIQVGAGTTQDGGATEYNATVSAGFGDLAKDKFNVFGVLSIYDRDFLGAGDRDFSKDPDQRPRGGFDFRSPTGNPGTWLTGGRGGNTDNTVFPACPPESIGTFATDNRTTCYYNFAPDNWLLPKTQRIGFYGRGVYEVSADLSIYSELGLNQNTTNGSGAPTPGGATLPVGHVSNPFTFAVPIRYRYTEVGKRLNEIETDAQRFLVGLQGNHFGWAWDTGFVWSKSESTNTGTNYISQTALTAAIPSYNFADQSQIPQSVIDGLRITTTRVGTSELKSLDFKAARDLWELAGGTSGLAVGVDFREESLTDTPDANVRANNVVGAGGTSSAGERDARAVYAELALPLFKGFEAQLALRYDDYSDFGSATTPKFALSYKPTDSVLLRGSTGKGFRAPSLVQLYQGASISFPSLRDVVRCDAYTAAEAGGGATPAEVTAACGAAQVRTQFAGNPALEAEKSTSYTLGIVFEPMRDLSVGLDWWKYDHTKKIDSLTTSYILNNADALSTAAGVPVVNRFDPSARDLAVGAPGGLRGTGGDTDVGILNTYFNAQRQETSGIDLEFRYRFNLGENGRFGIQSVLTYVDTFKKEVTPNGGLEELVGTWQYPKIRASTVLTWDRDVWNVTVVNNYVDSYEQYYQAGPQKVSSTTTWDLQVQYTGFKNWTLTGGARNIFNREPSWADENYYGFDSSNNDPRGAFWYARVTYDF